MIQQMEPWNREDCLDEAGSEGFGLDLESMKRRPQARNKPPLIRRGEAQRQQSAPGLTEDQINRIRCRIELVSLHQKTE